jgi:Ca2+-binding EF-hand superfamily protein
MIIQYLFLKIIENIDRFEMGNTNQPKKLSHKEFDYLMKSTKLTRPILEEMYMRFREISGNSHSIDRMDFNTLYYSLRSEPKDNLIKITELIFNAFDKDHNGT